MTEIKRCCVDCLIYKYQDNLPDKVVTQRQHYWDEVLTIACRTCNQHSNFCDPKIYSDMINDVFVKKLENILRNKLGSKDYKEEKNRIMEEKTWRKKLRQNYR